MLFYGKRGKNLGAISFEILRGAWKISLTPPFSLFLFSTDCPLPYFALLADHPSLIFTYFGPTFWPWSVDLFYSGTASPTFYSLVPPLTSGSQMEQLLGIKALCSVYGKVHAIKRDKTCKKLTNWQFYNRILSCNPSLKSLIYHKLQKGANTVKFRSKSEDPFIF